MMFKRGEIVTISNLKIGDKITSQYIFEIVHSNPAHSSVKVIATGKVEKVARLNRYLRRLTPAEIVLYGKG